MFLANLKKGQIMGATLIIYVEIFLHIIGKDLIIRKITLLRKGSYYTPGQNSALSKFTSYLVWNGVILNRLDVQTFKMNRCLILPRRLKQGPTHSWLPIKMLSCPQNGALVLCFNRKLFLSDTLFEIVS